MGGIVRAMGPIEGMAADGVLFLFFCSGPALAWESFYCCVVYRRWDVHIVGSALFDFNPIGRSQIGSAMKIVAIAFALAFAAPATAALSGHYEGQVPFILDMNLIFPGDGTMSFDQNVKVASIEIKCPTEKIAETASGVTFPNIATTGDCMGDALRQQKKDVSKFTIDINSDGSLTLG